MKEKITICKVSDNKLFDDNRLSIIGAKSLPVELIDMELYAKYQGEAYKVQGNIYCQYIVVTK